jgi:hypothetical protein
MAALSFLGFCAQRNKPDRLVAKQFVKPVAPTTPTSELKLSGPKWLVFPENSSYISAEMSPDLSGAGEILPSEREC